MLFVEIWQMAMAMWKFCLAWKSMCFSDLFIIRCSLKYSNWPIFWGADPQQVWFDYGENTADDDADDLGGDSCDFDDGVEDRWSQNNSQMVQCIYGFLYFSFSYPLGWKQ